MAEESTDFKDKKRCECGYCDEWIPKLNSRGEAARFAKGHRTRPKIDYHCSKCGSSTTTMGQNRRLRKDGKMGAPYANWYTNKDGKWLCRKCYFNTIQNPKWNPIFRKIHNPRRLTYKGKVVLLAKPPRVGVCNWCRAVVPFDCQRTNMHHESYHDDNVLKDAIELCPRCHYETKRKVFRRTKKK